MYLVPIIVHALICCALAWYAKQQGKNFALYFFISFFTSAVVGFVTLKVNEKADGKFASIRKRNEIQTVPTDFVDSYKQICAGLDADAEYQRQKSAIIDSPENMKKFCLIKWIWYVIFAVICIQMIILPIIMLSLYLAGVNAEPSFSIIMKYGVITFGVCLLIIAPITLIYQSKVKSQMNDQIIYLVDQFVAKSANLPQDEASKQSLVKWIHGRETIA